MNTLSRRQFLTLLGLGCGGTVAASTCGSLTGLLILAQRNQQDEVSVIQITATPEPSTTPESVIYPLMIPRAAWGALEPNHNAENENGFYDPLTNPEGWRVYDVPLEEAYQTVVIHHSVIMEGEDNVATLLEIQNAHRSDRRWADVGYHYFVGRDGIVYQGRDIRVRGTHTAGFNTGSVGVCLLGDYTQQIPTERQVRGAEGLVSWLEQRLQLTHLAAHNMFNSTTLCPGGNLLPYLGMFAANANLSLGIDGYIPPPEQAESTEQVACTCCHCAINAST